jgi:WD40 repeat protein
VRIQGLSGGGGGSPGRCIMEVGSLVRILLFAWPRMPHSTRFVGSRFAALAATAIACLHGATSSAEETSISFQRDILPLLRARCQGCHQPARREGGVDFTSLAGMTVPGDSGLVAVTPGDAGASELLAQVTPDESGEALMPQERPALAATEIELLRRWIAEGAKVDEGPRRPHYDSDHPPTYSQPATISALDVSPDGKYLAVSGVNETLLLDAEAARRGDRVISKRLIGLAERIESVRFSPDASRLAVAGGLPGESGEVQVWDVATGALLVSHPATADTLRGVAWSPDGARVAFGGADTNLYVIDAETGQQQLEQGAHADWVLASAFSADGKFVVSGARDQTLKLTEQESGRFVDNITAVSPNVPGGMVFSLVRHPGREMMAVGGSEGVPRTYMVHRLVERKIGDDNNLVRGYPAVPGRIFAVAFSPDGRKLAAASSDGDRGRVDVYSVPEAMEPPDDVKLIQGKVVEGRTAEESARLAAYHREGAVRLAYVPTVMGPTYAAAFLSDGKTIVSGGAEGVLRFHDAVHGTTVAEIAAHPSEQTSLAPSPRRGGLGRGAELVHTSITPPPTPPHSGEGGGDSYVEFLTDVMPVLAKAGCNAGTCHGARAGQNGFQLSLRGYDPQGDYRALTDDLAARRVNRARPESSLMLLKPTGAVPHAGGVVLEPGSRRYEILRQWIAEGARYNAEAPRVVGITLTPQNPIVQSPGETVAMQVTARYADGSERDVTADAFVESGDTETATADTAGTLSAVRRGEAAILARYEGSYAATTLTVMGDRDGFEWSAAPVYNHIDELVDAKLERMKITASGICTDEEFLRRVYLDLTGLPPTADEVRKFLADARESVAKRQAVVDRLIGSEEYVEHWTNRWADLLMVNGKFLGSEGAAAYRGWIRRAVAENWAYDRFVREIFTATGSNREHPAASYFKVLRTPDLIAETTTQVFLGVRFNCNKCHDHPFERWTQNDYYGWAAYFSNVRLQKDPESGDRTIAGSAVEQAQPLFEIIDDGGTGEMIHLRTGKAAPPHFPYAVEAAGQTPAELRKQAATWMTSADNRYFASSYVNRVWAQLTGVGVIEPIDDIRAGNPPTNPELLEWLTREFVAHEFDVQWLIRTICQSRTYQLSPETNKWNEDDRRNYSHALPRRLSAEALYDAVHQVVGSTSRLPGVPPGTRAAALPDSMIEVESGLLSKLGRPARESGCECERSSDLQLGPVMALLNGPTFADAIDDPESDLAKLEADLDDDGELANEVFLRVLGRSATPVERAEAEEFLSAPADERGAVTAALAARVAEIDPQFEKWRNDNRPVAWTPLAAAKATATMPGVTFELRGDGSIVASGDPGKGVYEIIAAAPIGRLRAVRLETLTDEKLPANGPGRSENGNFVLSQIRLFAVTPSQPGKRRRLKFSTAEATFSQPGYHVSGAIDAKPESGWALSGATGQDHAAAFMLTRPIDCAPGTSLIVELDQQYDDLHTIGKFRLSVANEEWPLMRPEHPAEWRDLLVAAPDGLSDGDEARLLGYYRSQDAQYRELERAGQLVANPRLAAVQDLAWALINSPAFLFSH